MEGLEVQEPPSYSPEVPEDFCSSVLSQFSNSAEEHHRHLCAVIGAMSQELKDQNLPLTPIAYFGATCSSLDRLATETEPPSHAVDALLTLLSMLIPRISAAILKKKTEFLSDLVVRILRSKSVTPGAAASGLKCISHLLVIGHKSSWSDVSSLYGALLGYITDGRPKVRKQSHISLCVVLLSFQKTAVLAPASEEITNIFERFLLLAGGSNASASEGPKGAQEVLYVLDALKDCLPLLSLKFSTSILKYFKSLLELRQPLVSRRITSSLNALCLHPTLEVSPELLLDLLCSLGLSISANDMSADDMTVAVRLLDVGMSKVYALNRQICIVKIPLIFNALRDIFTFEHEEALRVATEAFKSLIHACIDESLIKQGVDQIGASANVDTRKSGPTIIEKVCATIESLFDYHYAAVWDLSFQVASTMFDKLGYSSSYLLKGTLKNLADMQKLSDEDFPYRKQLHDCIGSALGAMGPETFLNIIPLKLDAKDLSEANVWLFPILKQYTIGARLDYFTESILAMVRLVRKKSQILEQEGRIYSSRSVDGLVYSLWSLLPSFCNYPLDTAESFKDLEKALCTALDEEPDVRGVICSSLRILIQQNKRISEGKDGLSGFEVSIPRQQAVAHYTPQFAADNLDALRSSSPMLFSVLSRIFMKSSKDTGGCLQTTISELASIADKKVVIRFFRNTMEKLLKVTKEADEAENSRSSNLMQIDSLLNGSSLSLVRAQLFDLAVAFLPGLDASWIDLLFVATKPLLKDAEGLIQKKAYKVLSVILMNSDEFLSTNVKELLSLMIEVLPSCHFSAKRYRLDCLYFLIVHASKDESEQMPRDIVTSFLTEIVLALKEANKKTRNRAYDILVQIGHAFGDEEKGGNKENLHQFFNMVAGGLAGETPHMISAAVKGLARLAYEFSDLISAAYNVLPSTFLLLQRKNREIVKASLGLLKVLVANSQAEGLQLHLSGMVEGLLKWQDGTKNHFKAKIKILLEMLVKKCGLDAVKAVMPEEHMKLLTNIRKIRERKERRVAANSEESKSHQSKATTSRLSRWNHTKIFSDFSDEETVSDAENKNVKTVSGRWSKASTLLTSKATSFRSKRTRKAAKSLPEDLFDKLEDEPLDLLDRQKTRSALRSSEYLKRKPDSDDEPEIDSEGRLIIREGGKKQKREMSPDPDSDGRSRAGSYVSYKSSQKVQKRRKTSETGWAYMGSEYASKKASGDVKRKGKLEPYAYWPLDRKMMSRRPEQRAAARKGMASVVKMTKKLEGKSASSVLSIKGLKFKKAKQRGSQKKNRQ
ncbi:LOW QUALITY PROTEIN: uncharacterized protein LOC130757308 [Actinidia eriantha]|uniref:LOW QUALITY PROTEIN: uncharacterized protein LOC130757308 n=1 Tax=Actinidia eriantha TaxID=165200 RepID=UPI00258BF419|nr:LOW QUALITY PROTEIN: uncharacterized protein LOC130757308 [Actinidia eriantha]